MKTMTYSESRARYSEVLNSVTRRINDEHRLIYKATEYGVLIAQCRYRYES
ncbi:type II toxin-antitoxin system YoeB family toxin [Streptomyces sp. NPDC018352]|uniref:type II toxin-antitoxin system YoeB family toxin n=1 Tax=Streptomyces sp. NPDC018352 TaxID=3157194 RepID=UPI0033F7D16B